MGKDAVDVGTRGQGPGWGSRVETGPLPSHSVCVSLSLLSPFPLPVSLSCLGLNGSSSIYILGSAALGHK